MIVLSDVWGAGKVNLHLSNGFSDKNKVCPFHHESGPV